jgi:predicted secreted protein
VGVAFVANCLLNQNAKVDGGAVCPGVYPPVVELLRQKGWRIEQLPCPELSFTGLNRFWAVREQYDTLAYRRHCRRLANAVAGAVASRVRQDEDVVLIGVEGSPSMGVCITSSDPRRGGRPSWADGAPELTEGEGIFVEELRKELASRGINCPPVATVGVTTPLPDHDPDKELELLSKALEAAGGS